LRRISIASVKDGDVLAKDLFSSSGVVLMSEGTRLKKEYIVRLLELGVKQVCIVGDEKKEDTSSSCSLVEEEIKEQCGEMVRNTIEKYTYAANDELKEIVKVADEIIEELLDDPKVMYSVSCVREKSNALYQHSVNVAALSTLIALRARLPRNKVKDVTVGALLHDIGYTTITTDISNIDMDNCDEKIRKQVMYHVVYGYTDVEKKDWVSNIVRDIILYHHERLDGSGYPLHIKGKQIRQEVRIVALCDQFDSMIYGNFMPRYKVREAMDYLMSQAGVQFDFSLVQLFMESVAAYPIGITVVTNEGDTAVVVGQNYKFPTRPIIRLLKNAKGEPYGENEERDLTKCLTLAIADSVEY